jgi:hypothetical protein
LAHPLLPHTCPPNPPPLPPVPCMQLNASAEADEECLTARPRRPAIHKLQQLKNVEETLRQVWRQRGMRMVLRREGSGRCWGGSHCADERCMDQIGQHYVAHTCMAGPWLEGWRGLVWCLWRPRAMRTAIRAGHSCNLQPGQAAVGGDDTFHGIVTANSSRALAGVGLGVDPGSRGYGARHGSLFECMHSSSACIVHLGIWGVAWVHGPPAQQQAPASSPGTAAVYE